MTFSRWLMGALYIAAGLNHFRAPDFYLGLMPPCLPWPLALIYLSGVAEVAGGIGVFIPRLRRLAGWGLMALLITRQQSRIVDPPRKGGTSSPRLGQSRLHIKRGGASQARGFPGTAYILSPGRSARELLYRKYEQSQDHGS